MANLFEHHVNWSEKDFQWNTSIKCSIHLHLLLPRTHITTWSSSQEQLCLLPFFITVSSRLIVYPFFSLFSLHVLGKNMIYMYYCVSPLLTYALYLCQCAYMNLAILFMVFCAYRVIRPRPSVLETQFLFFLSFPSSFVHIHQKKKKRWTHNFPTKPYSSNSITTQYTYVRNAWLPN